MRKSSLYHALWVLGALSLLLSACGPQAAGPDINATQVMESALQTITAMPTQKVAPSTITPAEASTATETPAPTATTAPSPTPALVASGPTGFPANIDPLTGLYVSDPKILNRRPIAVKVSNFPAIGRPHAGLSAADIVFEYFIGEGTNRFMAIYYGQNAPKVGPIRSGRLVDAQLVPMYGGILAYSGAWYKVDEVIQGALGNRAVISGPSTCPALCDEGAHTVISVFADTAKMTEYAAKNGIDNTKPNLEGMRFDPAAPAAGKAAEQVAIQFNNLNRGEWRYDAKIGAYLRWIENADTTSSDAMIPLVDRNTNKQLAFSNVIVAYTLYNELAPTLHELEVSTNAVGRKALLFRDGKMIEGTWKSGGSDKPMRFFTAQGDPLPLKPGNTWIALMGTNSTMTEATPGKFEVQFILP